MDNQLFDKHLTMADLETGVEHVLISPKDGGLLELIVRRPAVNNREVIADGIDQLRHQVLAQIFSLAVDVRVVAAREVDALEGARGARQRRGELLVGQRAVFLEDGDVAGLELLHVLVVGLRPRSPGQTRSQMGAV